MNETFKDTLCHIACLHSGDKCDSEKNCWGEDMAYTLPMNWYLIHREAVKLYHLMQVMCLLMFAYAPETGMI